MDASFGRHTTGSVLKPRIVILLETSFRGHANGSMLRPRIVILIYIDDLEYG